MKTGNTMLAVLTKDSHGKPQWSPVMKTGNTRVAARALGVIDWPQWSPVMKTGNTLELFRSIRRGRSLNGARS